MSFRRLIKVEKPRLLDKNDYGEFWEADIIFGEDEEWRKILFRIADGTASILGVELEDARVSCLPESQKKFIDWLRLKTKNYILSNGFSTLFLGYEYRVEGWVTAKFIEATGQELRMGIGYHDLQTEKFICVAIDPVEYRWISRSS